MPVTMIILGFGLVIAGLWFAVGGFAADNASGSAMKGISIQGPSWLILVALGVAVIMGGAYLYREDATDDTAEDATDLPSPPTASTTSTSTTSTSTTSTSTEGTSTTSTSPGSTSPETTTTTSTTLADPTSGPFAQGDDPYLDRLVEACGALGWATCDILYQDAPVGSDYEMFGATCGLRAEEDGLTCVEAAEAGAFAGFAAQDGKLPFTE